MTFSPHSSFHFPDDLGICWSTEIYMGWNDNLLPCANHWFFFFSAFSFFFLSFYKLFIHYRTFSLVPLHHGFFIRDWVGNLSKVFWKAENYKIKVKLFLFGQGKNTLTLVIPYRRIVMGPCTASVITAAKPSKHDCFSFHMVVVSWD